MQKMRTERMIDLLKKHTDGLNMNQLVGMLKAKSNKDISNTFQLLKHAGHTITKNKGNYMLTNDDKKITNKNTSLDKIKDVLLKYPDGITPEELAKKCDVKLIGLNNRIFYVRKRGNNVIFKDGKYFLEEKHSGQERELHPATKRNVLIKSNWDDLIPKQYHDVFKKLSDNDKANCVDMLFKSIYFHKSALALLDTQKELLELITSIEGDL